MLLNMFTRTVVQMSILHCFVLEVFLVRRTCQQSKVKVKVKQYPSMNFLFFKGYPSDPSVSRGVVALSLQMVTNLACSIQPCPWLSGQPQQSTYITIDNYKIECIRCIQKRVRELIKYGFGLGWSVGMSWAWSSDS